MHINAYFSHTRIYFSFRYGHESCPVYCLLLLNGYPAQVWMEFFIPNFKGRYFSLKGCMAT
jgi:hypothetical protein